MKSKSTNGGDTKKGRRDRYWSVMLVGEHGRIVPLKWFKSAFVAGCCVLVIALAAATVFGVLYKRQSLEIDQLQDELKETRDQAAKLRDEKDLYLTQFVASQKNDSPLRNKKKITPRETNAGAPEAAPNIKKPASLPQPKQQPVPSPKPKPVDAPKVQWKADIRKFSVTYDAQREVLKAEFRIYNISKPKKPLAGRTVVVFKQMDTSSLKWFTVPRVQISDGKPEGGRGQAFKINNYRTVTFRAYQQKAPVIYDTASVFIFSADGKLIAERDFAFHIEHKPLKKIEKGPEQTTKTPLKKPAATDTTPFSVNPAAPPPADRSPIKTDSQVETSPLPVEKAPVSTQTPPPRAPEEAPVSTDSSSVDSGDPSRQTPPSAPVEEPTIPKTEGD